MSNRGVMGKLQEVLDSLFDGGIADIVVSGLVERKLKTVGISPTKKMIKKITHRILEGDSIIQYQVAEGKQKETKLTVEFTDEDYKAAEQSLDTLLESLPDVIEKTVDEISKLTLSTLKKKWHAEYAMQDAEYSQFRQNVRGVWGKALSLLRMQLTMTREFGLEVAKLKDPGNPVLNETAFRLHVRACQVTSEIISLLENGYADGAMARWRTLHEISLVMALLSDHGDQLAERYVAHQVVEKKLSKDQYLLCYEKLGYEALSNEECDEIESAYKSAITQYGKEFSGPYGWAAGYVKPQGNSRIRLVDIETAAGLSSLASHYKFASENIHAGANALFFRLGLIDDSIYLAGASNFGLAEPGQNTALTLNLISMAYAKDCVDLDCLVMLKMLERVSGEIPAAFYKAEEKLKREHAKINKP